MYKTDTGTLRQRLEDTRHMLLDLERLLMDLPDEAESQHHMQARLVAWAHIDQGWAHVYHAWSVLQVEGWGHERRAREEEQRQRERQRGMGAHQVGE